MGYLLETMVLAVVVVVVVVFIIVVAAHGGVGAGGVYVFRCGRGHL